MARMSKADKDRREEQLRQISDEVMVKRRKAASDVTRQRMMRLLTEEDEWTAKEMADALDVNVNGLYYHLRVLEAAEIVVSGAGRSGPSGMERTYHASGNWQVTHELNEDLILTYQALLENAKYEAAQATYRQIEMVKSDEEPPHVSVNGPGFVTTHDEIVEFDSRLWDLIAEFRERGEQLSGMRRDDDAPASEFFFTYALVEKTPRLRAQASA